MKKITMVALLIGAASVILFIWQPNTKPEFGDLKIDSVTDRNKPPKSLTFWKKLSTKDKQVMLAFEKVSPNNAYNPYPNILLNGTPHEKKAENIKLSQLKLIKSKILKNTKITKNEERVFQEYLAKDIQDQVDLLKFSLQTNKSLTNKQKRIMQYKLKELQKISKQLGNFHYK